MKKCLSLILTLLLVCTTIVGAFPALTLSIAAAEGISGVETIEFAKNGTGGSPYMSGLNNPVGYVFTVDASKRLLAITIPDFATYSNNTNRGTFKLYQWDGSHSSTTAKKPLVEQEIVNHADHSDLVLEIPAELKVTGSLYFEIICLEGTAYTPWNAEGGLIEEIPGKLTDMQAYLGGSMAHPFAASVTIADMEDQSPETKITFKYDFTEGLHPSRYSDTNQIEITDGEGYATFTATGEDPYFRFADGEEPTPKSKDLAYMVIEYRTTAAIAAGEFFTNRKSGPQWGGAGTYVQYDYENDGAWHAVVADASRVWGDAEEDFLFAFRFDPLASGATAGDSIDVAAISFFGDGVVAKAFAAEREAAFREADEEALRLGSQVFDFGTDALPEDMIVSDGITPYIIDTLIRFDAPAGGELTLTTAMPAHYTYAKLAYRTTNAAGDIILTATSEGAVATALVSPVDNGYWQEVILPLDLPHVDDPDGAEGKYIDRVIITLPAGELDIAYLGFFSTEMFAESYRYPTALDTHGYVLGDTDLPVYTVTDPTLGDPFCAGGESFGQKFDAATAVSGITVPGHATWGADPANNAGYFKFYSWKGDRDATVAADPLVDRELKNLRDGEDLTVTFDPLPAGSYYFEVKMTTPADKAYTGFATKGGSATAGTVSFRNGQVHDRALVASYLSVGRGMIDIGPEYADDMTFAYDFSLRYDNVTEAFGLNNLSAVSLTETCDKGYLTITSEGVDPFFAFGQSPYVTANLMDHIVIKYRTTTTAQSGEFFVDRSDGATWGNPYDKTNILFDWVADGEWQIAVIDATDRWGNVPGLTLSNIRFDPLEKPAGAGETIDVAYIRFYANRQAAEAAAAAEYVTEDGKTFVKPPRVPLDPAEVKPDSIQYGENFTVTGANQTRDAVYSFQLDALTLTATGGDPYIYLYRTETTVSPILSFRYRTTVNGVGGRVFAGSLSKEPNGRSDFIDIDYIADGEWHTAVVNLADIDDFDATTNKLNYLRFDYLDETVRNGDYLDVQYIAFFGTEDEALVYQHQVPEERPQHTITFKVEGYTVHTLTFREGDTLEKLPVVPGRPGYTGAWEPFTLGKTDLTVSAVYTLIEVTVPELPAETEPVPGDTTMIEPGTTPPEPGESTAESETTASEKKGCGSSVGLCLPLMLLAAARFVRRRKDDGSTR